MRYLTLLLLITLINCNTKKNKNNYIISGKISNVKDGAKLFVFNINKQKITDTTTVENGRFIISGYTKNPEPAILFFEEKFPYPTINIWLDIFERTEIDIDIMDFKNKKSISLPALAIKKSKTNKVFSVFEREIEAINHKQDQEITNGQLNVKKSIIYEKYSIIRKRKYLDLIFNNPNNPVALNKILNYTNSVSKDSLKFYYGLLDKSIKNLEDGKLLKNIIYNNKLKVGDFAINFTVKDISGKTVSLNNFKNKNILLNFWSSNCAPCRKENKKDFPEIKENFKDLIIISFSLDSNEDLWKRASEKDGINWLNVSDLKGNNSKIINNYNVKKLPTTFLINKKGKIISKIEGNVNMLKKDLYDKISF